MQNPFVRLGKYQADQNDPQENRATETLAACLVFSEKLRREFLNFLFDNNPPFNIGDAEAYEVSTQQPTDDGSWVDLLIEKECEVSIVVEVKVKAKESGDQIRKYWNWLNRTRKGNANYVLTWSKILIRHLRSRSSMASSATPGRNCIFTYPRSGRTNPKPRMRVLSSTCATSWRWREL